MILPDPNTKTPYAYWLKFPPDIQVHPVRHISDLEPASTNPSPGQVIEPPPPVKIDGDEEWEVEEILESRLPRGKLQYVVKWTRYDRQDWQDARIRNGLQAIDTFYRRYPASQGPLPEDDDWCLTQFDHEEWDGVMANDQRRSRSEKEDPRAIASGRQEDAR